MAQSPVINEAWLGGTYGIQGNSMASRECINAYLQSGEQLAKYSDLILGTPGTQLLAALTDVGLDLEAPCRGFWLAGASPNNGSNLYWVFGSKLGYTYKNDIGEFVSVVLYDVGLDTKRVSITDNGFNVVVATGTQMLLIDIFNGANGQYIEDRVTDITSDLPFTNPLQVVYLKGRVYGIASPTVGGSQTLNSAAQANIIWYSSLPGLNAGAKEWNGLNIVPADLSSDPITAIEVRQGDIWAFGPSSLQIFQTTNDPDSPLQYASGSGVSIGTNAPASVTSIGSDIFWLGSNAAGRNKVYKGVGFNSVRISTHAIEGALDKLNELSDAAYAFSYVENGHTFYVLSVPPGPYTFEGRTVNSPGITFVYDTLTGQWHRRASRNPKTGELGVWQTKFCVFAWGKLVVGNTEWSSIMELRNDVYVDYDPTTDSGTKPITREYTGPIFFSGMQEFILDEFVWDIVTGHGPRNGVSSNPVASMYISYDSGNTFEHAGTEPLAKTGQYGHQVRFNGLGASRGIVVRIQITEDMQFQAGAARLRTRVSRNP